MTEAVLVDAQTLAEQVVSAADQAGVRLVRFLYTDNGGVTRGKNTHIRYLRDRITDGIGLTVAMQAMNMLDQLAPVEGMGPVGEVRLVPDPDTFVLLPYAPGSAAMTVDMLKQDGAPWEACPRSFLKRQVAACARRRFLPSRLLSRSSSAWRQKPRMGPTSPLDESLCFAGTGMTTATPVIDDMVTALEAQGLEVDQYYPELGHGQQELPIRHAPPSRRPTGRCLPRNRAQRRLPARPVCLAGAQAIPRPGRKRRAHPFQPVGPEGQDQPDVRPKGRYGISPLGYHFMAGMLEHLPALVALTCPSYNSYRRLQPHFWSSAYTAWGPDNREAAIRVPSQTQLNRAASANLELKASNSSSNPYLSLGGVLAAGLDGVKRQLTPGKPALDDPGNYSDEERRKLGIRRYPANLKEALDNLEKDRGPHRGPRAAAGEGFSGREAAGMAVFQRGRRGI